MSEAEVLSIKIHHAKPLELKLFTASMLCIESQYKNYLAEEKIHDNQYDLCIQEVKQGSIDIKFIKRTVRLIEHHVFNFFIDKYLKPKIESIVEQKIEDETGYTLKEMKEILSIVSVISKDYKSKMDMEVHVGDNVITNYSLTGIQANAVVADISSYLITNQFIISIQFCAGTAYSFSCN